MPEYDFCYCDTCRQNFKEEHGVDLLKIKYPEASLSWRNYRYNRITHVVNELSKIIHKNNKIITAAVFPTPEVARRNVRKDWFGASVKEGVHFLCDRFPLYAGLFLPNFKSP